MYKRQVTGSIAEANGALADEPELVNTDPYNKGWLFQMQPTDGTEIEQLLDAESYEAFLGSES